MAIYIPLDLLEETDSYVVYEYTQPIYGPDPSKPKRRKVIGQHRGRAKLDKSTGTVTQLLGEDWDSNNAVLPRIAKVMIKCHLSGSFPAIAAYEA